jgi:hypothetical protein
MTSIGSNVVGGKFSTREEMQVRKANLIGILKCVVLDAAVLKQHESATNKKHHDAVARYARKGNKVCRTRGGRALGRARKGVKGGRTRGGVQGGRTRQGVQGGRTREGARVVNLVGNRRGARNGTR